MIQTVCETFTTPSFRIYPNNDILGVAFGGALKNIIAIACGISEGLALGCSSKAALMTRGLHEIRKLAVAFGCKPETLNGLAGMGDLCLTCSSTMSRNFRFGMLLAQGVSAEQARKRIGMVVEGAYTCVSALQLSKQCKVALPIAEAVSQIIYHGMPPIDAVGALMQRTIKEEHLMKVVTAQGMAALEARAYQQGSTERDFMENAGRGIAQAAHDYVNRICLLPCRLAPLRKRE